MTSWKPGWQEATGGACKADYEIIIYVIVWEAGDSSLSLTVLFFSTCPHEMRWDEEMSKSKYPVMSTY